MNGMKRLKKVVMVVGLLCLFFTHIEAFGESISEQHLRERYKELGALYQQKKQVGHDLTEIDKTISQGRIAFRRGDLDRANELLRKAEALLSAVEEIDQHLGYILPAKVTFSEYPLGVAFGASYTGQTFMPHIRKLGVRMSKVVVYWHQIEPQEGQYRWCLIDNLLNQLKADDEILITVFTSSTWGTEGKGKGFPPYDYNKYYRFIYNLVRHCQGKVKYWTRDTEPASPFHWDKNKAHEYVKTQKYFYQAVKAADPKALVVDVSMNGVFKKGKPAGSQFFDYVLKNGQNYFDILDIRLYWDLYTIPYRVGWFLKRMRDCGYVKPIITTEYGGPVPQEFPTDLAKVRKQYWEKGQRPGTKGEQEAIWKRIYEARGNLPSTIQMFFTNISQELEGKRDRIHCRDIVQRTVLALSCGVKRAWYWSLTAKWDTVHGPHPIFGKLRLMDQQFKKRFKPYYTYKLMAEKLRGITSIERVVKKNTKIFLFKITRYGVDDLLIGWEKRDRFHGENEPPTNLSLQISAENVKITDVFGNNEVQHVKEGSIQLQLTDTPLFVEIL